MEWLRRLARRLLGRKEPEPEELVQEYIEQVKREIKPPRTWFVDRKREKDERAN